MDIAPIRFTSTNDGRSYEVSAGDGTIRLKDVAEGEYLGASGELKAEALSVLAHGSIVREWQENESQLASTLTDARSHFQQIIDDNSGFFESGADALDRIGDTVTSALGGAIGGGGAAAVVGAIGRAPVTATTTGGDGLIETDPCGQCYHYRKRDNRKAI